ncbi:ABC transporter ATP-binding protein [Entomospira entomophila]|uniref:ABC transporter ATP-binding protein n=1 Tax=Entomospira entomophila TaxID=2719988 RepID=A0A968KRD9_9SPIO|nr:ABC transporter ATP-binding protein [Entomospira entomophilus]NIZ40648.1 ABC transporter ATP-binding protein [Entomospira entomophilus]WDI34862.1 ABC transporter ATP-binding protein [Entomospira entomophilus]
MERSITPLLVIDTLGVTFETNHGRIEASHHVNLSINPQEIWGIVGESGSGKSVSMMAVTRLLPEYASIDGSVSYRDVEISTLSNHAFHPYRGRKILYLFQDPLTALNPYFRIKNQLYETIKLHHPSFNQKERIQHAHLLLEKVGFSETRRILHLYPHQCSGGMRQRILIALALACNPEILIADEPTSALDAISAAQVMQLLHTLQQTEQLTLIIISHDISILCSIATHIAVFQHGTIIEQGRCQTLINSAKHPYTRQLLDAMHRMQM